MVIIKISNKFYPTSTSSEIQRLSVLDIKNNIITV